MKKALILLSLLLFTNQAFAGSGVCFIPKQDYSSSDRPIAMSVVMVDPTSDYKVELTYGGENMNKLMRVTTFAQNSGAYAATNASYFKQDTGTPIGLSILDGRLMTGPLFNRSVFGVDKHGHCFIGKPSLVGNITIGKNKAINIENINQPIMSTGGALLYNHNWGAITPNTSDGFYHIAVERNHIIEISETPVEIPETGYAIVVRKALLPCCIEERDLVRYSYEITPKEFCKAKFAFAAGPNLVVNGSKCVDYQCQHFTPAFANVRTSRTAIGIKNDGTVILLTVDSRQKGVSEGVTLSELADVMLTMGAYQAMNLDGGSSTQMVVEGRLVNMPTVRLGAKVTNAVIVVRR